MRTKQLNAEFNFDDSISQSFRKKNLQTIFSDQVDYLIPLLKNQMNNDQNISYLLSPSSSREEGYWFLFLAIKEQFLRNINNDDNNNLPQAIRELKESDESEFEIRSRILLNSTLRLLITLLDPNIPITENKKYIFGYQDIDNGSIKSIFSFDT